MKNFLSLLCLLAGLANTAHAKPPNVVLILSDDQSYTDYGFMGHPHIETPHLDKLASESALFRRGYVPTALCRPSLATLFTGLYSHQNKITGNNPANTPQNKAHAQRTGKDPRELIISNIDKHGGLPHWLGKQGYVSHQSGKWWEGSYQRGGFTEGMTRGFPKPGGRHGDDGLKIGRAGMEPVLDFIDRSVKQEKPFFIWYAPFLPHTPHNPPERLHKKYLAKGVQKRVAQYYAMCEWFDETCGALMNHIDKSGIAEDTLVIYVTDNGWIQTENGGYGPRSKRSPYEGGTRNPIMFRWKGTIAPADRPELCSSIDFVPTVLAAAGAKGPHDFPGLNLLPELKSGKKIKRDVLFGESFAHDIADIENPQASLLYRWVIKGHDKLLLTYDGAPGKMKYPPQGGGAQLFDLKKDPAEKVNLAKKNPKLVKELSALLDGWYVPEQRTVGKVAPVTPGPKSRDKPQKRQKGKEAPKKKQTSSSRSSTFRPNILILYADDLGFGDLTSYNADSKIPTPHLDQLAAEGIRFTDGHSSSGICTPSRYALLTGRHHWRKGHGIVDSFGRSWFKAERLTLPEMLKEKGYHTAAIGKWHLGWNWNAVVKPGAVKVVVGRRKTYRPEDIDWSKPIPDGPLAHGFDHYFGDTVINMPPFCWIEDDKVVEVPDIISDTKLFKPIKEGGWGFRPGPMISGWDPYTNIPVTTERGVKYIHDQAKTDDPFFLYFAYPSPHVPIIPNDEFDGKSQAGPYGDFVVETDDSCGKLLQALKNSGQDKNTIVIFSADNGPAHYAYARDHKFDHWSSQPFRGLKRDVYEGGHRVPFIVKWPGVTKAGTVSDALVSQIDIMATIADFVGYKLPDDQAEDSHNLAPLLRGDVDAVRTTHIHNTTHTQYAIRHGDWVLIDAKEGYSKAHDEAEAWEEKHGYPDDDDQPAELFNLVEDIGQRNNLAAEHPERVVELQSLLKQIREQGYSAPRLAK